MTIFAGGGNDSLGNSTNTTPTNVKFGFVSDILVDGMENVYIVDSGASVIYRVSKTNVLTRIAGYPNQIGFAGDGGPAISALLSSPRTVTLKRSSNELFISDFNNCRIRKVAASKISTVVGGNECYNTADNYASLSFIDKPTGIAYYPYTDRLYIATGSYLRYIEFSSNILFTLVTGFQHTSLSCDNSANVYGLTLTNTIMRYHSSGAGAPKELSIFGVSPESFTIDPYNGYSDGAFVRDMPTKAIYQCDLDGAGCYYYANVVSVANPGDFYVDLPSSKLYIASDVDNIVYVSTLEMYPTQVPTEAPTNAPTFTPTFKESTTDSAITFSISQTIGGLTLNNFNSMKSYETTFLTTVVEAFGSDRPISLSDVKLLSATSTISARLKASKQSNLQKVASNDVDQTRSHVNMQAVGIVLSIQIVVSSTAKLGYTSPEKCYDALRSTYLGNIQNKYFDTRLFYNAQLYGAPALYSAYTNVGSTTISSPTYGKQSNSKRKKKSTNLVSTIVPILGGIVAVIAGLVKRYGSKLNSILPSGENQGTTGQHEGYHNRRSHHGKAHHGQSHGSQYNHGTSSSPSPFSSPDYTSQPNVSVDFVGTNSTYYPAQAPMPTSYGIVTAPYPTQGPMPTSYNVQGSSPPFSYSMQYPQQGAQVYIETGQMSGYNSVAQPSIIGAGPTSLAPIFSSNMTTSHVPAANTAAPPAAILPGALSFETQK